MNASLEIIKTKIQTSYTETFTRGWIKFTQNGNNFMYLSFGVQIPETIANKISQNDIGHHILGIHDIGNGVFSVDCLAGVGIYTKPEKGSFLAFGRTKAGWRKKTTTRETQIAEHVAAYFKRLEAVLLAEAAKDNLTIPNSAIGTR
jgi:hypothetical protein